MVCLGNICRSPLAEGILKNKLKNRSLSAVVDSAGTAAYHVGDSADPRSVEVALRNRIDITNHSGRQFIVTDFDRYDYIYAMDRHNFDDIIKKARTEKDRQKVSMLMNEIMPGKNIDVPDPYYGGKNGFDNVFDMIDKACDKIVTKLENQNT